MALTRARAALRRHPVLVAVTVVITVYYVATHYAGWSYRGGPLLNHGLFTRPRYEARFASLPMNVAGTYEYTFSHFPVSDDDSAIMLVTESPSQLGSRSLADAPLARVSTQIRIRVIDQYGQLQCDATGTPANRDRERLWVTSADDNVALYHVGCVRLRLAACAPCRLTIAIGPVDPSAPPIRLIPTIQGGGLELP